MAAKVIAFSTDNVTFLTLPGNTGDLQVDGKQITDTVFGQNYDSNQPGLINWKVTANGLYKGFAGYVAVLQQPGATTAFTGEACTSVTAHQYQITNTAKRVWDRTVAVVVKDNGTDVTATHVDSLDYLFGVINFNPGYTVLTPVTVQGSYFPLTTMGTAKTWTLEMTANMIDNTDLAIAQANGGFNTFQTGLIKVELSLDGFYVLSSGFEALLEGRTEVILSINPDGGGVTLARGFFKPSNRKQSGAVGALEDESMTFMLTVPTSSVTTTDAGAAAAPLNVFAWQFSAGATALQTVLQNVLNTFLSGAVGYVKYLSNGTNGTKGSVQVSDVTMKGGLDNMNEFEFTFQGSGQPTAV